MSCRAGTRALVGLGLFPWLGLGSPRALGCPSVVTVGKVHLSCIGAPEISLPEGENLLPYCECPEQSAGSHMEPPAQHGASRNSSDPYTRALGRQSRRLLSWEVYRCRKAGTGIPAACLVGMCWANRKQEQGRWSHVSPQQESLLCPVDHDVLFCCAEVALQQGGLEVHPMLPESRLVAWALQHSSSSHRWLRPVQDEI